MEPDVPIITEPSAGALLANQFDPLVDPAPGIFFTVTEGCPGKASDSKGA